MPHLLPFHEQLKYWAMKDDMRGFDCLGCDDELGASAPSLADVRAGRGVIKVGMSGDAVMYVQGLAGAIADGNFGPATENTIKAFQRAHGLTPDGVVGQSTLAALDVLAQGGTAGVSKVDFSKPAAPALVFSPDVVTRSMVPGAKPSTALAVTPGQSWWTQPAWQGGKLNRWQVGAIGAGTTVGLFGLLGWLLSNGAKAVK
jgi:hypothetical protein